MPPHSVQHVALEQVSATRRHVLDALMQLYLHDFSEHAPLGSTHGEMDEEGRFAYAYLDAYWQEAGQMPFLVRADGRVAGFVLVNRWSALDRPLDGAVAEFFVLRKYRLAHVGTRAAHLVFHQVRGRWEVPVAAYNQARPCCSGAPSSGRYRSRRKSTPATDGAGPDRCCASTWGQADRRAHALSVHRCRDSHASPTRHSFMAHPSRRGGFPAQGIYRKERFPDRRDLSQKLKVCCGG